MAESIMTPQDKQNISYILGEIATQAMAMRELASQIVGEADALDVNKAVALETMAGYVGLIADLGIKKVGGTQMDGTIEGWFFADSYQDTPRASA